jgi:hypothetical protein
MKPGSFLINSGISHKDAKKARGDAKTLLCPVRAYLYVVRAYHIGTNAPSGLPVKYSSLIADQGLPRG